MIVVRTVQLTDALARANVIDALRGSGGPVGVVDVVEEGPTVTIRFDDAVTAPELIDDLVAVESIFVPDEAHLDPDVDDAAAIAAAGLGDPDLDGSRIIETHLHEERPDA